MDSDFSLEFLRVVEQAAIACAHTMGQGDRHKSDQVAVESRYSDLAGTTKVGEASYTYDAASQLTDLTYSDATELYKQPPPTWVATALFDWQRVGERGR